MKSAQIGKKAYAALMFALVSVVGGMLVAGLVVPFAGLAGSGAALGVQLLANLPAELETPPQSERSKVLLADGTELTNFFDENRIYVPLQQIAPIMRVAQLAIEDHRFYEHGAIDLKGTLRALVRTSSGSTQGGSTLTQQYVKLAQIEAAVQRGDREGVVKAQERTMARKIQELRYALALEEKLTKDQILERYLNIAYYGDGAYGVEAAAHHYFNIKASQLNLAQAAMLAGLVQNPVATDPVNHPNAAIERRSIVLNRMAEVGLITQAEADAAKKVTFDKSKVQYTVNGCQSSRYPFLCDYVERTLLNSPSLGRDRAARKQVLYRGGLTIQTIIDPKSQDAAQKAVSSFIDPRDPAISTMAIVQPGTGLIIAMAQSRPQMGTKAGQTYYNYNASLDMGGAEGYQAGSTFKAFTLAAALEKGIPPSQRYNSPPSKDFTGSYFTACSGRFRSTKFPVKNVSPSGNFSMWEAAKWSVNTYFVQLAQDVSLCAQTELADRVGVRLSLGGTVKEKYNYIPSFPLGTAEVTPLSMANAYATFAARGKYCNPIVVKSVRTKDGKPLTVEDGKCRQVMDQGVADGVNAVLRGVMSGTGARARIPGGYDQAGKTGTIDGQAAVWMVGYTPEVSGAAMIAVDKTNPYWKDRRKSLGDRRMPFSGTYLSGSSGTDAGAGIYRPAMQAALQGRPKTRFTTPGSEFETGKQVSVPDCDGLSLDSCRRALEGAGFSTEICRIYHYSEVGSFLGTDPSGKATIASRICLLISRGPRPTPRPEPKPTTKPSSTPTTTRPSTTPRTTQPSTTPRTTRPAPVPPTRPSAVPTTRR